MFGCHKPITPVVYPFKIFENLLPSAKFDVGNFLRNIRVSKMRICANFDLNLHFQGHLLQELDGQTQ